MYRSTSYKILLGILLSFILILIANPELIINPDTKDKFLDYIKKNNVAVAIILTFLTILLDNYMTKETLDSKVFSEVSTSVSSMTSVKS